MRKFKLILMIVVAIATGVSAQKAETDSAIVGTLRLSLAQAKEYAQENNIKLQNAGLDAKVASAQRWQTIATMLPQANASFNYQNMLGYEMEFMGGAIAMPASATLGVSVGVGISGAQIVGALLNTLAMEMSDITVNKTRQDINHSTTSTYMSILAMNQTISLLENNLANMRELYEITLNSVKVGVSEETAADQILVQVSSMESALNSTKRAKEMLYNSLALLLGCGVDAEIILTDELDNILSIEDVMALMFEDFVIENNYDYKLLSKNTELAKQQVTMAAMDYLPNITAGYQYSYRKFFSEEQTMNMTPPNAVSVSINLPIWSSGQRAAKVTEKKLAYQKAINTQKDTENALKVQAKQLKYNLSTAHENYTTQKKNIEVTQRIFQNTTEKFEQGYSSNIELTNASTTLLTAQNNYVSAMLEIVNAHIALKQLLNVE